MNAALLMMTSTFMAGADAPAAAAPAACCASACDPCAKASLLDKIKGRLGSLKHKHDCCEPAPKPCPPPPPKCCKPEPVCDPCARPNLLDKLKGKLGGLKHKHDCCAPACDGCAAPATPATPHKDMPKPMDPKKTSSDAPSIAIPSPGAIVVPALPVIPASGPKLSGSTSPY